MRKTVHSRPYRVFLDCLVQARKSAGITQEKLAKRLKRPQSFVAKYETGERRLDLVEFLQITAALAADPYEIMRAVERVV